MQKRLSHIIVGSLFLLFFAAQFVVYPLNHSLIGNTDAIAHISIFHDHINNVKDALGLIDNGYIFYPANGVTAYVESYLGETILFGIPSLIGFNDVWSTFFLIVMLFALNAFAVYLLAFVYTDNARASFLAGLFFAASCYMQSNMELLNGLAFFGVPMALYFLELGFRKKHAVSFMLSALFLGITFYFSFYHYLFGLGIVGLRIIWELPKWNKSYYRPVAIGVVILAVLSAPNFIRLFASELSNSFNPMELFTDGPYRFSMDWKSFFSSQNGNLIYPANFKKLAGESVKMDYRANLGIVMWLLFLIGIWKAKMVRGYYLIIFAVFGLIALGPYLDIQGRKVQMPLSYLYNWELFSRLFRIPGRSFVVANFAMAIIACWGYLWVEQKTRHKQILMVIIALLFSLENLAIKIQTDDHTMVFDVPAVYDTIANDDEEELAIIAELPSSLFTNKGFVNGFSEFSRDYRYQYWQTRHHQHTINGSISYFPQVRMDNNDLLSELDEVSELQSLINANQLDYVVFHKDMVMTDEESGILVFLSASDLLSLQYEDDRNVLFEVINR